VVHTNQTLADADGFHQSTTRGAPSLRLAARPRHLTVDSTPFTAD
jgi:hypothetical protein